MRWDLTHVAGAYWRALDRYRSEGTTLADGDEVPASDAVDLFWPSDLLFLVLHQLRPLGEPARRTADGEQDGEHLGRELQRLIDQP